MFEGVDRGVYSLSSSHVVEREACIAVGLALRELVLGALRMLTSVATAEGTPIVAGERRQSQGRESSESKSRAHCYFVVTCAG